MRFEHDALAGRDSAGELAILFCRPRGSHSEVDLFEYESHAAEELEIPYHITPIQTIVNEEFDLALEHLPPGCGRRWLYRGWMLSMEEYTGLYEAMLDRGDSLVVHPSEFEAATYMPEYLPAIADHTPESRWIWGINLDEAWEVAQELGPPPWMVKDHVKSAKQHWREAFFIPEGVTRERFNTICENLIDIRGDRLERGLVFRRYVPLERMNSDIPGEKVFNEYRLMFWEGELIAHAPYYDIEAEPLDVRRFAFLGDRIDSPFFAADVARTEDGRWVVVEINDGGSVVLPELLDPRLLYRAILKRWR